MKIRNSQRLGHVIAATLIFAAPSAVRAQTTEGEAFNNYVVQAVAILNKDYAARGYADSAYTHEMKYGPDGPGKPAPIIKPTKPPYTMCVAAVAEVIVTALNLYAADKTTDPKMVRRVLQHLPAEGWMRMRPQDIRAHIWVDSHLKSYGTADALSTFGVGRHAKFSELKPGAFINVNRLNNTGHAVVFLGYIDRTGKDLPAYGPDVAGFRYFSSQGKAYSAGSGFGYRWAFFNQNGNAYCPVLDGGRKTDCGIIYTADQDVLNTGYMLLPDYWDAQYRDKSLKAIADRIYRQNYSRGVSDLGLPKNLTREQFLKALNSTDTMQLNPKYLNQDMPDDSPGIPRGGRL